MKVLHVTETHEEASGGVTTVVDQLLRGLGAYGIDAALITTGASPARVPAGVRLLRVPPSASGRVWGWSPALLPTIQGIVASWRPDLIHVHGAWLGAQWLAAREAWRVHTPFLVSFHGMLEPYHWSDRGLAQIVRKRAYWAAMGRPTFTRAAAVHAITPLEARHLARLLPDAAPPEIIPNAITLPPIDAELGALARAGGPTREPIIAFVGRLHPKKGVCELIEAFDRARLPAPWRLIVAGPEWEAPHTRRIRRLLDASPSRDRISFHGPVYGAEKWRLYSRAWAVAVPSKSEVVGMVNLEASACGAPTITTGETGLEDWSDGGGMLCAPTAASVAEALRAVSRWSRAERDRRGAASRRLIEDRYSWDAVGGRWIDLYRRIGERR